MEAESSEIPVDLHDARLQVVLGLLIVVVSMVGLSLNGSALMLQQWARWFATTVLFFFGMAFTMRALTKLV